MRRLALALLLYAWMLLRGIPILLGLPVADQEREISEFDRDLATLRSLLR
jgi:hypothetical protein